jgi:glycosyltransferase involved in cell wall biosynthesis
VGLGQKDGRNFFPDIPFFDVEKLSDLSDLDDKLVFVNGAPLVETKHHSYMIMHYQPPADLKMREKYRQASQGRTLITNSKFAASIWSEYLGISSDELHIVYPFADPAFAAVERVNVPHEKVPVLYAGRLIPEKGIYTLLESLHHESMREKIDLEVTTAGNQTLDGQVIEKFLRSHDWLKVIPATHNPADTAAMFASHQIVVMPSNPNHWAESFGYWRECFGMISVEAQHAGCYVVASNDAGLRETNCGDLILVEPGNSHELALGIEKAIDAGPLTDAQRKQVTQHFTRTESVNALLAILK